MAGYCRKALSCGWGRSEAARRGAKVSGARGQPLGRRMVQVVERDQSDMEEVVAARRIAQAAARRSAPEPPAAAWP